MMSTLRLIGLAAALSAAGLAHAHSAIQAEASPALGCLSVAEGAPREPVFPFDAYKHGLAGRVQAKVTLPGGPSGNEIEILSNEGDESFVAAARKFLQSLRAPCLKGDETATLNYDFVFRRDQREVFWSRPIDANEEERKALAQCVRHLDAGSNPEYPTRARRLEVEGRVLMLLTFTSADGPPSVNLLRRRSADIFDAELHHWAAGLRMPCHNGGRVTVSRQFEFRMEGNRAFGFKGLTLPQWLSMGKGVFDSGLLLDTTTMGCPFQLKLIYYQPLRRNAVGEVGNSDPARRPLLDLLAGIELDLNAKTLDSVFGDTAEVSVPCVKINLRP